MKKNSLFAALCLISFASVIHANWGGWTGGNYATGNFNPYIKSNISVESENLLIELHRSYADVAVEYELKNNGPETDVDGAFPCFAYEDEDSDAEGVKINKEIEDYRILENGKEIDFRIEKENKSYKLALTLGQNETNKGFLFWYVSRVHFKKNEIKKLKISYVSIYLDCGGGWSENYKIQQDIFRYLFSTAATWKGPIKKGKVTIRPISVDDSQVVVVSLNFIRTGKEYIWDFKNLTPEPWDDLTIFIYGVSKMFPHEEGPESKHPGWYAVIGNEYYLLFSDYNVQASSTRLSKTGDNKHYNADNIHDKNQETAWVAGGNKSGIGEFLTITLNNPVNINGIGIIPGYEKSKQLYFENNRVSKIEIVLNNEYAKIADLVDEYNYFGNFTYKAYQWVDVSDYNKLVNTVRIQILDVYKGKINDTCIDEILLKSKLNDIPPHPFRSE